jgi:hypothetical protein
MGAQMANQPEQAIELKGSEISPRLDYLRDKTASATASHRASEQRFNEFSDISTNMLLRRTTDHSRMHSQPENSIQKDGFAEESRFRS